MQQLAFFQRGLLTGILICFTFSVGLAQKSDLSLKFDKPAINFLESLPIGNGHLGGMIFGNPNQDRVVLNEKSLWSGGVQDADRENAYQYLKPIQELLLAGKNQEAEKLLQEHFVSKGVGSGYGNGANEHYGSYQTLGDLWINWKDTTEAYTDYSRILDLENAIATTSWKRDGVEFEQIAFSSIPDDVMIIKLTSSKKGKLNFDLGLSRKEHATVSLLNERELLLSGQLPNKDLPGMKFAAILSVIPINGTVWKSDQNLTVKAADTCYLIIASATDYNIDLPEKPLGDPVGKVKALVAEVDYRNAKEKQIQSFQSFFNRNSFKLTKQNPEIQGLSTPERLARFAEGKKDAQLPVLYYNFGKYLLISSSQPGQLPANLQGIWATEYQAPWNGDYHLDINIQMNYWLAEPMGLGDLAEPIRKFTSNLTQNGEKTAKAYYNADGWVAHVISNPWYYTSPGEGANWGSTMTGGAWMTEHIWEHFRYTRDTAFLREYYPVLKGAAEFLSSVLIEEPENNYLVTAPSNSPENTYLKPDGYKGHTVMGPAMDMQITREVFGNTISAAKILGIDQEFSKQLSAKKARLAPNKIGKSGDLNEWLHDWQDVDPQHRHVSHLYGLHPYDEITRWGTPDLAAAAEETLKQRGDGGTGWSRAWKINFWARLGDGDHAFLLLKQLLQPAGGDGTKIVMNNGGTYPNLFCAHPPFQIDGNFGGAAGILEMLMQSQGIEEVIRLLPALPSDDAWQEGKVKGMMARGGFEVDFQWKNGMLTAATVFSKIGGECKILLPKGAKIVDQEGKVLAENLDAGEQVLRFETIQGERYLLKTVGF
ncbi:glycoside hydrolase N-terminal domain-containing protein [Algoriphagus aestuarii]|nr:glycoside hydrolase N-terminal domain-containing protein [Algoriphagus aestuarii]